MLGHLARQIQTRLAWQVGLAVAVLLVAFGIATAIVARNQSDESSMGGLVTGVSRDGSAGDLIAPEEQKGTASVAPAPAGVAIGENGSGTDVAALDTERAIIRTGSIDLEVRSVIDAFEQVRVIATGAGGFVSDSTFSGGDDRQSARLTLRVPADRFGDVVSQLRELAAEVRTVSSNSRDVTGEVTDLEATLRNLRAVETQYAQLLSRANTIGEVLQVQERLNQVRLQIDRTEARRALLQSQTEMSTLSVTLQPVGTADHGTGLRGAAAEAWEASLATLEEIATAAVVVVVYSWWIVPLVILAFVLIRRRWGHRAPAEAPPAAP